MSRTLHIDVDLTVKDEADDMDVADAVFAALHALGDLDLLATETDGIESIDSTEPIR